MILFVESHEIEQRARMIIFFGKVAEVCEHAIGVFKYLSFYTGVYPDPIFLHGTRNYGGAVD